MQFSNILAKFWHQQCFSYTPNFCSQDNLTTQKYFNVKCNNVMSESVRFLLDQISPRTHFHLCNLIKFPRFTTTVFLCSSNNWEVVNLDVHCMTFSWEVVVFHLWWTDCWDCFDEDTLLHKWHHICSHSLELVEINTAWCCVILQTGP